MCGFHLTARWRLRSKLKNSIISVAVNHVVYNFGHSHIFFVSTYKTIEYTSNNRKYIQNPKRNFYFCVRIRKHIMISSKSVSFSLLENDFFHETVQEKNLSHKIYFRVLHESFFLVSKDCQQAILSSSSEVKIVSDSISSISHVTSEIDEFRSSKRSSRVSTL